MADIFFQNTKTACGNYMKLVRVTNVTPGDRSRLSLALREYQACAGDIGEPERAAEAMAKIRAELKQAGHTIRVQESAPQTVANMLLENDETTLRMLFQETDPEQSILDEIGSACLDKPVPVHVMSAEEVGNFRTLNPGCAVKDAVEIVKRCSTWNIVKKYVKQFLTVGHSGVPPILVAKDAGYIMDGHHRAVAAFIADSPIRFVDVCEAEN